MTVVGKILVFVNLVFSLVVGGLVVVVFVTRTNWEEVAKQQEALRKAAEADRNQAVADAQKTRTDADKVVKALTKERDDALTAKTTAETATKKAQGELTAIKTGQRTGAINVSGAEAAAGARKEYADELVAALATERARTREEIKKASAERTLRIKAEIQATAFKSVNQQLEDQVRELALELARSKAGTGAATTAVRKRGEDNPPSRTVVAKVDRVDRESNLVQISAGSDAGLAPGHTLKVFRFDRVPQKSQWLGTIEILSVEPHKAVGRPVKGSAASIRPGDRVASRLGLGGS